MDNTDGKFTCRVCGKTFEPEPDAVQEVGIGGVIVPEEEIAELEASGDGYTVETLEAMDEYHLKEIGLTRADVLELKEKGFVTTGAIIVCQPCQDRIEKDDGHEEKN